MSKKQGSGKTLVIVESPAKARTIGKFLGGDFVVESSIGHIRDLPSDASEIPEEIKDQPWARLGVNVDQGFEPVYIIPDKKKAQVRKLKQQLKDAAALYLATDEDREGEAIAWHLVEVLKPTCPVRRMVFDEITKTAITKALDETREVNRALVNAQETRRILDRLYGYEVSPVLWRKVKPKLSAGRVQSVATRLVVERERARMRFMTAEYWDTAADLRPKSGGETFNAKLVELAGKRIAVGKDFDETTGRLKRDSGAVLLDGPRAGRLAERLKNATFTVTEIAEKPFTSKPYAPFITSTLQQEAGRKLRFGAQRTMRIAQSLYENGYITYMRTDSPALSQQAITAARNQVTELFGREYLPDQPRGYRGSAKNAQEAHEAIRPAGETFRTPKSLAGELDPDQLKLYELIWKRTVASQMKDSEGLRTSVRIDAPAGEDGTATFSASGKVIKFAGYLRAYVEGADDPAAELEDQEKILPAMQRGQALDALKVEALQHFTQPPARYTEASLIKELEERGIGRPSTYATIMQTIQDRGYVWLKGNALVPTFTAFAVTNLLERHLGQLVDYDFTARMEGVLDTIASGEREAVEWLRGFYFGGARNGDGHGHGDAKQIEDIGLRELIRTGGEQIDARAVSTIPISQADNGEPVAVRVGRYGPYVQLGDTDQRATIPDDIPPDELTLPKIRELLAQAEQGDKVLGHDPRTSKPVYIKSGRFGPYVQLGDPEMTEKGKVKRGGKPKMASLWPGMKMDTLTLEDALLLLSFPRELGKHPENGEPITVQDGRFGPYVRCGNESRSLPNHESLRTTTLEQALELLKQPKRGRGRTAQPAVLADLGKHPETQTPIQVKSGRFGPYVTDGTINATIPKGRDPNTVALPEAMDLLAARERKLRDQGEDPRAPKKRTSRRGARRTPAGV